MDDVDRYIEDGVGELVELARTLVRFDTTSVDLSPGSTHRTNDEAALQVFVAGVLRGLGAEVDQWEPDAAELTGHPMLPPWHHWENRPQTVGVVRGSVRECAWTFAASEETIDAAGGAIAASIPTFTCRIRPRGDAEDLLDALADDPLWAPLPGGDPSIYDQLSDQRVIATINPDPVP